MKVNVGMKNKVKGIELTIGRVIHDNRLTLRVEEADIVSTQKNESRMDEAYKRQSIDKYQIERRQKKIRKKKGYRGYIYRQGKG